MSNRERSEQLEIMGKNFNKGKRSLLKQQRNEIKDNVIAVIAGQRAITAQRTQCSTTYTLTAATTFDFVAVKVLANIDIKFITLDC